MKRTGLSSRHLLRRKATLLTEQRPLRIAILASGAGSTADALCAAAARNERFAVVLIISNNSRAGIHDVADQHSIPFLHLSGVTHPADTDRDVAMRRALLDSGADLVVCAGYMKRVGPRTLATYTSRIINTHPALLPRFGGPGFYGDRVHAAVLEANALESGASVHLVTEEYDQGPVIGQTRVPVLPADTTHTLGERVRRAEKRLLVDVVTSFPLHDVSV